MATKRNKYRGGGVRRQGMLRSWLKSTLGCFVMIFGLVLLSGALAHAYYALLEASWLSVGEIRVTGLKHLEKAEVLNALGVARHAHTLTLKMAQLAARVEALPWVDSAVVRLDLPGRLVVEIVEREPMAVVLADGYALVDRGGRLFAQTTREESPDYLLVTGCSEMGLHVGSRLPREVLQETRSLVASLEKARAWLPASQIAECRWQGDEGFVLVAAQGNIPIRLGSEELDRRLERLHRVFQMLGERQWLDKVKGIDLDYSNRAYVEGDFPRTRSPKPS